MHQCLFSIRDGLEHLILIILIINIIVSYDQNILLIFYVKDEFHVRLWILCQAVTSVLCLHYRPETVHCSTKEAYTSEITFLALKPWLYLTITEIRANKHSTVVSLHCLSCKIDTEHHKIYNSRRNFILTIEIR